jgi:hypothetical protein
VKYTIQTDRQTDRQTGGPWYQIPEDKKVR